METGEGPERLRRVTACLGYAIFKEGGQRRYFILFEEAKHGNLAVRALEYRLINVINGSSGGPSGYRTTWRAGQGQGTC